MTTKMSYDINYDINVILCKVFDPQELESILQRFYSINYEAQLEEIYIFFGIKLIMERVKMSDTSYYWDPTHLHGATTLTSRP